MRIPLIAVLLSVSTGADAGSVNIVENPGFETGEFYPPWYLNGPDRSRADTNLYGTPHTGNYAVDGGAVGSPGYVCQILTTTPGQTYAISFWLLSDGETPNAVVIHWGGYAEFGGTDICGGEIIFTAVDLPEAPYTQYLAEAVATGSNTLLAIGLQDDPGEIDLDDVSVVAIPEPSSWIQVLAGLGCFKLVKCTRRNRRL